MPNRTTIQSSEEIPPPLRGRLGGGAQGKRLHMPRAQELQTRTYARLLRENMTDADKCLWKILRGKQLNGLKFRRQFPVEMYIADFICLEQRLVIELDGGQHAENKKSYDDARTTYLESQGFHVLRFWNNDVLQNPQGVVAIILDQLLIPPPQPSPARGEGVSEPLHA